MTNRRTLSPTSYRGMEFTEIRRCVVGRDMIVLKLLAQPFRFERQK